VISDMLCYEHDVCVFVDLSVTLVDCDHIVYKPMGICQDRLVSWLPACQFAKADPDRAVFCYPEFDEN